MTRRTVLMLFASSVVGAMISVPAPATTTNQAWRWPLDRTGLGRTFEPPATDFGPGHRGVDIAASVGARIRAVAPGRVLYVGRVGGAPVVVVGHGAERSTYQPVSPRVRTGDAVRAGEPLGRLLSKPSHCAGPCLHLGRRDGDQYLDPLDRLTGGRFELIDPTGSPPPPPPGGDGTLRQPVGGPVTSPFGMRIHPLTGRRSLHDGVDLAAACGTRVGAAGRGRVTAISSSAAYGRRVVISHRGGLETSYSHLGQTSTSVGASLQPGDPVGHVGNTGWSTGCHLHFSVRRDGSFVDPLPLL